jgi:hypothetical protein
MGQTNELVIDTTASVATSAIMQRILCWGDNSLIAQLTADQLGACTVPAHLLWIYLFDWMTMATVAMGLAPKWWLGFRFVIAASSSSTGLSILVQSDDILVGSVTAPNGEDVPVTLN